MGLVVVMTDVLVDALLELGQHVLEVPLLVARRLELLTLHARVARPIIVNDERAEVDESQRVARRDRRGRGAGVAGSAGGGGAARSASSVSASASSMASSAAS